MFFNLFTIIILCIQANKVNTNIFETTNHSIRSTMRVIKICERQNMALFKKKIIVSSSYDFSSSHTTVFLNSSMRETNRCETHEDYRQWCNLFNNTMYLDWSTTGVSWSQNFQWFTDDIMCPRYLTSVLNIHPHRPSACPVLPLFTLPCPRSDQQWPHVSLTQVGY